MVRVSPLCVVQFAAVAAAAYVLLNTSFLDNILNVRAKGAPRPPAFSNFKKVHVDRTIHLCVCE